jgi:hypothetical protein
VLCLHSSKEFPVHMLEMREGEITDARNDTVVFQCDIETQATDVVNQMWRDLESPFQSEPPGGSCDTGESIQVNLAEKKRLCGMDPGPRNQGACPQSRLQITDKVHDCIDQLLHSEQGVGHRSDSWWEKERRLCALDAVR